MSGADFPGSVQFFLDAGGQDWNSIGTLEDAEWQISQRKDINRGYTDATLWIRIFVQNESEEAITVLLEEDFTLVRVLEARVFRAGAEGPRLAQTMQYSSAFDKHRLDRSQPFHQRMVPFYNPVLPLSVPAGRSIILVKLQSDMDMIAALQLWSPESFGRNMVHRQIIFGILYGSILLMFLYNGLLWLSLKEKTYLFYSLYCVAFAFYFLAYYGHGAQFLWGDYPWFELRAVPIIMSMHIGLLASEFFRRFLDVNRSTPIQLRVIRGIQIFSVGLLGASVFLEPSRSILIFPVYAIAAILIMAVISVVRYRQGYKPALFAILAFVILWVAGIGSSLRSLGIVPYNNITMYGVAFGNVAELLLLSLGLGYRLKQIQAEGRVAGERSQSLVHLLEELPYAIILRYSSDRSLAFANRAAREMYPDQAIRDWKSAGIQAFRSQGMDRWIAVHEAHLEIDGRKADLQIHWEISGEMESRLELEEKHTRTVEAKEKADENRRAQDEFLQSMTVEIRRPMAAVLQAADVLDALEGSNEQKNLTGILLRSSRSLVNLLNDLSDLSRIESRGLSVQKTPFDPRALLSDAIRLFEPGAKARGLALRLQLSSLPPLILQDSTRINQVISNLLNNAIKFSETGTITLIADYSEESLRIQVSDQGPGIPQELQKRLFQRFEQLQSATYRRYGGTGLGLAICKGIIEGNARNHWLRKRTG
ncbi:MAG: hypothetical protein KDK25_12205 [Leptospiraceae bacterium]|nr:hypothetical protein [Leptospiraceae bacterium]